MLGEIRSFGGKEEPSVLRNLNVWASSVARRDDKGHCLLKVFRCFRRRRADIASRIPNSFGRPETGDAPDDYDVSAINKASVVPSIIRAAVVRRYTATPFANILSTRTAKHRSWGDLFPRNFIISLPVPSKYVGPVQYSAMQGSETGIDARRMPIIREVNDQAMWMPDGTRRHVPLN